jgi:phospholipid/cholesterol/gamma-HCH transport system substrate-binding protein
MKRDNINYTLVGTLVLVSMSLLLYTMARLSGNTEKHDVYYTTFSNVAGVSDGTPVTYDGFQVGRVQTLEPVTLEGRLKYRLGLSFKQDWKIPNDSTASISESGLLSGQLIDIQQGKNADLLKPGQEIRALEAPALMAGLGGLVSDLRGMARNEISPMLREVRPVLQEMRPALQDVRSMVQNLNKQTESLAGMLKHKGALTLDQASSALTKLNVAAENLGHLTNADNRQHLSSILKNGEQSMVQVMLAINEFQQLQAEMRHAMQQTQTMLSNLERASRHMNELSRQLHESPSVIFSSPAPVDAVEVQK